MSHQNRKNRRNRKGMAVKISVALTPESIGAAVKRLKQYKADLNRKTQALLDAMVAFGEDTAINLLGRVDTGGTLETIQGYRNGNKGVIVAGGAAIFLEFGTGITHNGPAGSSPHPKGSELGMTIGGYGQGKGADPGGWWYYDEAGRLRHTKGVAAQMFMWKTARELERIAPELAREVFQS
jgi:hypothetical protein